MLASVAGCVLCFGGEAREWFIWVSGWMRRREGGVMNGLVSALTNGAISLMLFFRLVCSAIDVVGMQR